MDFGCPFSVRAYNNDKYFQIFTKNDTKFMHAYSMCTESNALINMNLLLDELHILKQYVLCYLDDGAPDLISESIKKAVE